MIEWKKLPRSIRFENQEIACDVWAVAVASYDGAVRRYKYTVYNKITKSYIDNGTELTEDKACEKALKMAKV
jgi:hypothetical protein